jgi:ATP-dependent DNA helicase RecG
MKDGLETKKLDFKEKFTDEVLETLCAFANTDGGQVIIGVRDNGEVKGIEINNKELQQITEKIVTNLGIYPDIEIKEEQSKKILVIKVPRSKFPVSYKGKYYERVGNTTREMSFERLSEFLREDLYWDSLTNEANFEEIDPETVKLFIRLAKSKGRLTIFDEHSKPELLFEHLKLFEKGKLTNAAILLFGKDPQRYFLNSVLRIIRLKNHTTIVGDKLIDGNLFKQVIEGEEAIKYFINVRYEIKDFQRDEIWDYPLAAIREAMINALIHRDYFRWGVQTQIKIFDDYIWFYNIGGLPKGITLEQLKKPHSSVPRNPLIVHIFYLAGFIEEVGSGTGRMIEEMKKAGLPEPELKEEMGGFSVYLRKDPYTEELLRSLGLNERQIKAVMYVKGKGKITNKEYQELNEVSNKTAYLELAGLVEKGVFTIEGMGKKTFYKVMKK